MSSSPKDTSSSDEEIFFGKLSLKEIRKHLFTDKQDTHRQSAGCVPTVFQEDGSEKSFSIIETQSVPNLIKNDTSFLSTDQTLHHGNKIDAHDVTESLDYQEKLFVKSENCDENKITPRKDGNNHKNYVPGTSETLFYLTPLKENGKDKLEQEVFSTPLTERKLKVAVFKTPAMPLSHKKLSTASVKKTPLRSNAYQHITSPIASYINESPRAPLLKDVRPMKPLPGPSSIPKIVKSASKFIKGNKENITLPPVAYRCAKKTQMIDTSNDNKLSENHWSKKIGSSLPRPLVIKHSHRENVQKVMPSRQEDSFADLSLHQADLSVCTKKSAFIKPLKKA